MKIQLWLLLFILIFLQPGFVGTGCYLFAQESTPPTDTIKNYPGIPLITYGYGLEYPEYPGYPPYQQFVEMEEAGIFALQAADLNVTDFQNKIQNTGLLVMPEQTSNSLSNYIVRYTEAAYTVWEAEGTPPEDGLITLYHNSEHFEVHNGTVRTKTTTPHDTMIYGPMYSQERYYAVVRAGDSILYTAKYHLKLEDLDPQYDYPPNDTICILQVTTTKTYNGIWGFFDVYVIDSLAVTYQMLQPSDSVKEIDLVYDLMNVPDEFLKTNELPHKISRGTYLDSDNNLVSLERKSVGNIEFKVLWRGNPEKVRLSVDKIIVSDDRGWNLFNEEFPEDQIVAQINENRTDFGAERIAGWIGMDEPWNLDNWGPIKKVNEIIEANSTKAKLWFQFNCSWNGRFGDYGDPAYSSKRIIIDEFMRGVKKANIWVTSWLYDLPCSDTDRVALCTSSDYRLVNLRFATDSIYQRVVDAKNLYPGLHYGISIQTGRYYDPSTYNQTRIREISGRELLYQTNLSLIYGAKLISPWLYFGRISGTQNYTGIRNLQNNYAVTDKYNTLKDTIGPRLNGLMGITLRKLKSIKQFAGSQGINALIYPQELTTPYEYVKSIQTTGGMNDECFVELGIFQDLSNTSAKYFMPLNRYYSNKSILTFNLRYLTGYNNWQIYDYVDTTHISVVSNNGTASFVDTIFAGDAKLYSIMPVVQNGGTLAVEETLSNDETLKHDMSIDGYVELTINPEVTYTIQDTITLYEGSFVTGEGYVNIETGGAIKIMDWSKSVFRGEENNHPKIYWGEHPSGASVLGYNIYRKWDDVNFSLINSVDESTFAYIDEDVVIFTPTGEEPKNAEYYVTALLVASPSYEESDPSNTIDYWVEKASKKNFGRIEEFTYALDQNYPNPFNPTTVIKYEIKNDGLVSLVVYDILGREVTKLVNDNKIAGRYEINLDASELASGIYLYQLKSGDFVSTKKMMLVK